MSNYSIVSDSSESDAICDDLYDMILCISSMNDDITFHKHGYKKLTKICDTLQGDLYKARRTKSSDNDVNEYVVMKRTDKNLFTDGIANEDGFVFCVTDNCIQEAQMLSHLTIDNAQSPFAKHIVQYVDFFGSKTDFFLVMEHISSDMNLKQFISRAKEHIQNGQLSITVYKRTIRKLLWELFATVQWLHASPKYCHLNLRAENVLLQNAAFIRTATGMIIDPDIMIKLGDFSASQQFTTDFLCSVQLSYFITDAYSAPKVFNGDQFDARCADNWCLGMILFECMTLGQCIYDPSDTDLSQKGHWALCHLDLERYLKEKKQFHHFDAHSFALLNGLLNINESKRLQGINILQMKWFELFYKKDVDLIRILKGC